MPQTVNSTRFGELEVPDEALIEFPDGLIGVGGRRFALLTREESGAFRWLQDAERGGAGAAGRPTPSRSSPTTRSRISDAEAERIGIERPDDADVLVDRPRRRGPSRTSASTCWRRS